MLNKKSIVGNSRAGANQHNDIWAQRDAAHNHNMALNQMANDPRISINAGLVPRDVYQEMDTVTIERIKSDEGDVLLNDLMPLSKAINLGKLTHRTRTASDSGIAQTSISGQTGVKMDQVEFDYDGSIVPVHDVGYYREWREMLAMSSEGFDALIDDTRESASTMRRHLVSQFLDGHRDKNGNLITIDGVNYAGVRNDSRVANVPLTFDYTDNQVSGEDIKREFIDLRNVLYIDNNCEQDAYWYISREIMANLERRFSQQYDAKTIQQELSGLMGVAGIKVTSALTGNEILAFPHDSNRIRPVVGMAINTVAMPRQAYNSRYEFSMWGAIGYEIRPDFANRTCVLYASS